MYSNPKHQKKAARRHYEKNAVKIKKRAREFSNRIRAINRMLVIGYLHENPCVDCGEPDIVVLEFDHVRGVKKNAICTLVNSGCSTETLLAEIAKCEVRCANCHRRRTHKARLNLR